MGLYKFFSNLKRPLRKASEDYFIIIFVKVSNSLGLKRGVISNHKNLAIINIAAASFLKVNLTIYI